MNGSGTEIVGKKMKFPCVCLIVAVSLPLWGQSHPDLGNFEDYREESRIWLATLAGEAVVNPVFPILATEVATPKWEVPDGALVKEDDVLGFRGADKIDLSLRDIELRKSRYANDLSDLEWTNRDNRKALAASIVEMELKIEALVMTPKERELLGGEFEKKLKLEQEKIGEELALMKTRLEGSYYDQALKDERTALNLDLDKAVQAHDELVKESRILSPSDGRFEILVSEPLKVEQEIGQVRLEGRGELRVEASGQAFGSIPLDELVIETQADDGKIYRGKYLRTQGEKLFERADAVLVFSLRGDEEKLPDEVAGRRMCRIYRTLEEPGRIVPKEKLLFEHPDEIVKDGWAKFVESRWPGTKLVSVGPRDLVIRKEGDEN